MSSLKFSKDPSASPEGHAAPSVCEGHDEEWEHKEDPKVVDEVQLKVEALCRLGEAFVKYHTNRQVVLLKNINPCPGE